MGEMKKNPLLRKGSRGDEVRELQGKLGRLGFDVKPDGIFGDDTEKAVIQLQTMFGYTVDALVGEGTHGLIDAQLGYGWNAKAPDAAQRAMQAQGKPMQSSGKPIPASAKAPGTPPKGAQPAHKK